MKIEDSDKLYMFYETHRFISDLAGFLGERSLELLYAIQNDLLADPLRWPMVKGTGGARKGRVADPASDRGKSGSYRYLYLYLEHRGQIYLLFLFAKNEQDNLSAEQTKLIARWVEEIKKEKP
jgi:hypothetical protein